MPFLPIKHEDLRIGLSIKLKGSWFRHPFPTNTFMITSSQELDTLRTLTGVEIFFDPDRSDDESAEEGSKEPSVLQGAQPSELEDEEDPNEPDKAPPPDILKVPPLEAFQDYCEGLKEAHEAYHDAFQQSKTAIHDLTTGNVEGVEKAKDMIRKFEGIMGNVEATTALMNVMSSNEMGEGIFSHSLNVCILSIMVGREFDLTEEEISMLALGALYHDIGELNVPGKILLKRPNLSQAEWEVYRQHPGFGKDMVKNFSGFPKPSLDVIYHHHERLDGSGYPMGLKGPEAIDLFSKIVMVVDRYDELCNDPDAEKRLTPSEALSHIFLKEKTVFWNDAIVTLIRILGVYPPGSLVQLSDGSLGMVINVNVTSRLRPLVLLYSKDSSKEETIVLDLEDHEELSISQNLRPKDVSKTIREYLHPRRMLELAVSDFARQAPLGPAAQPVS